MQIGFECGMAQHFGIIYMCIGRFRIVSLDIYVIQNYAGHFISRAHLKSNRHDDNLRDKVRTEYCMYMLFVVALCNIQQ